MVNILSSHFYLFHLQWKPNLTSDFDVSTWMMFHVILHCSHTLSLWPTRGVDVNFAQTYKTFSLGRKEHIKQEKALSKLRCGYKNIRLFWLQFRGNIHEGDWGQVSLGVEDTGAALAMAQPSQVAWDKVEKHRCPRRRSGQVALHCWF